jgi:hypothetical protein
MQVIRKSTILFLCLTCLLVSGCIYTNIQIPLTREFDKTEVGVKTGQSSYYSILGLVAWGDAGAKAAAENGGLKVIKHADTKIFQILLGLYYKQTTIVYGE